MPQLGQLLVDAKIISKGQLEEAIQAQVIFGGRLGTNLIELEYVDEQTITKYLAKKHGIPTAKWISLTRIKPQVLKMFNKNLAKRCEAFPVKVEGKNLYVVMSDPTNLAAIEEIEFATSKKVKPLVLPEVRVYDLLTRFYNIGREFRYINLAMMYKTKPVESEKQKQKIADSHAVDEKEWAEREKARAMVGFDQTGDLLSEEEFQKIADDQFKASMNVAEEPSEELPPQPVQAPPQPAPPVTQEVELPTIPKQPAPPAPEVQPRKPEPAPVQEKPVSKKKPYKQVAQILYSLLMKNGVQQYISKEILQEFLKVFVKSQLKRDSINTNFIANWMIIESDVPVDWLEAILVQYKEQCAEIGIKAILPGEKEEAPVVQEAAEIIEDALPIEEAQEIEPISPVQPAAPEAPVRPSPPPAEASVAAQVDEVLETIADPEVGEASSTMEVLELSITEMATEEEAEAYIPEEGPEEEEEEEVVEEYAELTLDEARAKLQSEVDDRRDISRIFLGYAKGIFKRSVLFTVRGGKLFGWDGTGEGIDTKLVESIMLPLKEPGAFSLVNQTNSFYLGPMQPGPMNDRYLKILGGAKPNNVFIMPIVVNEKVVYILYGDNGDGQFVPVNAPELQILAYQVPQALDKLIMKKKAEAGK